MRTALTYIILPTVFLLTSCGNNSEQSSGDKSRAEIETQVEAMSDNKVASAMMEKMSELADTLDTVQDEESAKQAAEKIAKIGIELEALANKADSASSTRKMSIMMQANRNDFMTIQTRLATNMARIAMTDPKLLQIIGDEMDKLNLE